MNEPAHPHLRMRDWPFRIAASEETAHIWVGRPTFQKKIQNIQRSAARVRASRIVLLWASFGSGKTHALLHLQYLARQDASLIPLFVVTPKGIRSFIDVYQAIVDSVLRTEGAISIGRELFRAKGGAGSTDVERALIHIAMLNRADSRVATAWLRGEKVSARDAHNIGLGSRLDTVPQAVQALRELMALLVSGGRTVFLLVDEVQDLKDLGRRHAECVGGLHEVFDHTPNGLVMVLSFQTATQSALRGILGETLYDRKSDLLELPPFSCEDSVAFVNGLLAYWSTEPESAPFPFTEKSIDAVVNELQNRHPSSLTPRDLIKAFDSILRDADLDIEDAELDEIDVDYALGALGPDA